MSKERTIITIRVVLSLWLVALIFLNAHWSVGLFAALSLLGMEAQVMLYKRIVEKIDA